YQTPASLLYRALEKDKIPKTKRHYDYQLWGVHAAEDLETVQPWDEQPSSVSRFYDVSAFPLKLPPGAELPPQGHLRDKPAPEPQEWSPSAGSFASSRSRRGSSRMKGVEEGIWLRKYSW